MTMMAAGDSILPVLAMMTMILVICMMAIIAFRHRVSKRPAIHSHLVTILPILTYSVRSPALRTSHRERIHCNIHSDHFHKPAPYWTLSPPGILLRVTPTILTNILTAKHYHNCHKVTYGPVQIIGRK